MTDTQSEQVETTNAMPIMEGSTIRLDALRLDGGTQSRDGLDEETVKEYAATMKENGTYEWPAIKVVFDGQNYWLVDGFHRVEAAKRANRSYFWAEIIQGTQREAVLMSTGVNASHGLRRTNADKRRAVETLLRDPEWSKWADREIARRTLTSNRFVGNVRDELAAAAPKPPADGTVNDSQAEGETRTVQRGGKTFEMKVGSIGADKRGGQGADTWALIERGAWKFMSGIYYAIDQRHHIIYYAEAAGNRPLTAAMCEAKYPGCIAVQGASLNSDWQQYQVAGYVFKSPDEFPRQQPPIKPAPGKAKSGTKSYALNDQFLQLDDNSYFIVDDSNKVVWDTPMDWPRVRKECLRLNKDVADVFSLQAGHVLKKVAKYDRYRLTTGHFEADASSQPPDTELHPPGHSRNPIPPATNKDLRGLMGTHWWYGVDTVNKVIYKQGWANAEGVEYKLPGTLPIIGHQIMDEWETYSLYSLGDDETYPQYRKGNPPGTTLEEALNWYKLGNTKYTLGATARCRKCWSQRQLHTRLDNADLSVHADWEPGELPKLWRCKRCKAQTSDALMKIIAPSDAHLSGETPTNGLTSEVIAKHRRLAEITHFRLINNKCREAGRALQKINYEHGLEAAKIAAKGMTEILADCANDLVKADKEWQQRLDEATQPKKAKWGRKN